MDSLSASSALIAETREDLRDILQQTQDINKQINALFNQFSEEFHQKNQQNLLAFQTSRLFFSALRNLLSELQLSEAYRTNLFFIFYYYAHSLIFGAMRKPELIGTLPPLPLVLMLSFDSALCFPGTAHYSIAALAALALLMSLI